MILGFLSVSGFIVDLVLYLIHHCNVSFMLEFNFGVFTIVLSVFLGTSLVLLSLGIMCEYLQRMMVDAQDRPVYIIEEELK